MYIAACAFTISHDSIHKTYGPSFPKIKKGKSVVHLNIKATMAGVRYSQTVFTIVQQDVLRNISQEIHMFYILSLIFLLAFLLNDKIFDD